MAFLLFYTTHPDEVTARGISDALLAQRLIACANIFPIQSAFWWEGAVQQEGEWVAVLKTRPDLEQAVERVVAEMHPYDTPCILRFAVRANDAYEKWIAESTGPA